MLEKLQTKITSLVEAKNFVAQMQPPKYEETKIGRAIGKS